MTTGTKARINLRGERSGRKGDRTIDAVSSATRSAGEVEWSNRECGIYDRAEESKEEELDEE